MAGWGDRPAQHPADGGRDKKLDKAFLLFLEGEEGGQPPSPFVWIVDRYCEEFQCGIPQAINDLENAPHTLVSAVLDQRAFVRTKAELDRAKDKADGPTGPMSDRVWAAIAAIKEDKRR